MGFNGPRHDVYVHRGPDSRMVAASDDPERGDLP
jgi:hypothetical protein